MRFATRAETSKRDDNDALLPGAVDSTLHVTATALTAAPPDPMTSLGRLRDDQLVSFGVDDRVERVVSAGAREDRGNGARRSFSTVFSARDGTARLRRGFESVWERRSGASFSWIFADTEARRSGRRGEAETGTVRAGPVSMTWRERRRALRGDRTLARGKVALEYSK